MGITSLYDLCNDLYTLVVSIIFPFPNAAAPAALEQHTGILQKKMDTTTKGQTCLQAFPSFRRCGVRCHEHQASSSPQFRGPGSEVPVRHPSKVAEHVLRGASRGKGGRMCLQAFSCLELSFCLEGYAAPRDDVLLQVKFHPQRLGIFTVISLFRKSAN